MYFYDVIIIIERCIKDKEGRKRGHVKSQYREHQIEENHSSVFQPLSNKMIHFFAHVWINRETFYFRMADLFCRNEFFCYDFRSGFGSQLHI